MRTRAPLNKTRPPLRGIFFDLDDTLIGYSEAERVALAAGCRVAAEARPEISEVKLASAIYGAYLARFAYGKSGFADLRVLSTEELRRHITTDALALLGVNDPGLTERLLRVYAETERDSLHAFPEAGETLTRLRPYFTLGVITNGPSAMQRGKLAALALEGSFDEIVVDTEFGHPKPDRRIFAYAARRVGLAPEELLFVGNSLEDDVAGAKAAGWLSVWMNRDGNRRDAHPAGEAPEPDYVIGRLSDVLNLPDVQAALAGQAASRP